MPTWKSEQIALYIAGILLYSVAAYVSTDLWRYFVCAICITIANKLLEILKK